MDELGTLDDAIAQAKKAAGLDPDSKLERLNLPKPTSPFEALFGPIDSSTRFKVGLGKAWLDQLPFELADQLKSLEVYDLLAREKVLTVMPYRLLIK